MGHATAATKATATGSAAGSAATTTTTNQFAANPEHCHFGAHLTIIIATQ